MLSQAAIALGSNLGDRQQSIRTAIDHLGSLGRVTAVSSFHDTEPVGYVDQPRFLNAAAVLETELTPLVLLREMLQIELKMGRNRVNFVEKGPRVIDLDLLLFGDQVIDEPGLKVPHPAMHERMFVLGPLAEIAPGWLVPKLGLTVGELRDSLMGI